MEINNRSSSHAVYNIKLHIIFVTKYRRKILAPELLDYLKRAFADVLAAWRCALIEFGGASDHVHLLVDIHPALDISVLINNLKTASARRARNRFGVVGSVGGATLETVRAYVDAQGTEAHARKAKEQAKTKPAACPPPGEVFSGARTAVAVRLVGFALVLLRNGQTRKGKPRCKQRMHKTPAQREIEACYYWLEQELAHVSPAVVVALGATALKSLAKSGHASLSAALGTPFRDEGRWIVATYHPSYLLRVPGEAMKAQAFNGMVAGLRQARELSMRA